VITRTGRLPLACLPVGRQVRPTVDRKAPRGLKSPPRRAAYARSPKGHQRFDLAVEQLRAAAFDALYFWEVGTDATNYFLPFCRLAPLQVTGWGWPETSGAPELDCHVSSAALAPPGAERLFTEPLARLPRLAPDDYITRSSPRRTSSSTRRTSPARTRRTTRSSRACRW
jgi:hypothetical protein